MMTTPLPTDAKQRIAYFGELEIIFWTRADNTFLRYCHGYHPEVASPSRFAEHFEKFVDAVHILPEQWPAIIAQADTVEDVQ